MNGEISFDIKMSNEEIGKIKNILGNATGLRHFAMKLKTDEYLDLVEYKDYKILEDRINKAIEYIENNSLYEEEYDYDYEEELYLAGIEDSYAKKELLEILKGGNK